MDGNITIYLNSFKEESLEEIHYFPIEGWDREFEDIGDCTIFACNPPNSVSLFDLTKSDETEYFIFPQKSPIRDEIITFLRKNQHIIFPSRHDFSAVLADIFGEIRWIHVHKSISERFSNYFGLFDQINEDVNEFYNLVGDLRWDKISLALDHKKYLYDDYDPTSDSELQDAGVDNMLECGRYMLEDARGYGNLRELLLNYNKTTDLCNLLYCIGVWTSGLYKGLSDQIFYMAYYAGCKGLCKTNSEQEVERLYVDFVHILYMNIKTFNLALDHIITTEKYKEEYFYDENSIYQRDDSMNWLMMSYVYKLSNYKGTGLSFDSFTQAKKVCQDIENSAMYDYTKSDISNIGKRIQEHLLSYIENIAF